MHLKSIQVSNFRILSSIEATFDTPVSVLVGPNASGKSTILEAIRLVKALLAPRTQQETNQVLFALGAGSPHLPNRMIPAALAGNPKEPVEIRTKYQVAESELNLIDGSIDSLARNALQSRMGQTFSNQASILAFFNSSNGSRALEEAKEEINLALKTIHQTRICDLSIKLNVATGQIDVTDPLGPLLFQLLDQHQNPYQTIFSYFPADRALPLGEQGVQLGAGDAVQQLEGYNSQPQQKYLRLKNTIFNSVIVSEQGRKTLEEDFAKIFGNVLKGRKLVGFGVNEVGMLSIKVQDTERGVIFDLDGLSSGEKGLILTCLLIARSVAENGLVLLDEPELHLNPAICKGLLTFFVETYAIPKNIQLITCSHSPEILMGSLDRTECGLYHLESPKSLTKVRRKDEDAVADALRRLGSSEVEALLYKATIFVEGSNDVDLLDAGFGELFLGYKWNDRGGRKEVEKLVRAIQEAEQRGENPARQFFIFDMDDEPTALKSSDKAKILQWDRRCLENYLLDFDVITDLLKTDKFSGIQAKSISETAKILCDLGMSQLDAAVARKAYRSFWEDYPRISSADVGDKSVSDISTVLASYRKSVQNYIGAVDEATWKSQFLDRCNSIRAQLTPIWEVKWAELADGKTLIKALHHHFSIRMSLAGFKKRLMQEMRLAQRPGWRDIESQLKRLLSA